MNESRCIMVPPESRGERLDRFLAVALEGPSRSQLQHWIREGAVLVDDARVEPSMALKTGQRIVVQPPPLEPASIEPEDLPIEILYQDDWIAVIEKPPGMTVHPGAGQTRGTLVNALLHHLPGLSGIGGVERPGIVHRLDRETSGLMVVAKSDAAHVELARQFAQRTTTKIYRALVEGVPKQREGRIEGPIGRHPVHRKRMTIRPDGRAARTDYRVLQDLGRAALVECRIYTGRTHQIRVHLKSIGCGLLGDSLYHPRGGIETPRLMLHAWRLAFSHPGNHDEMEFTAPLPPDFCKMLSSIGGHDPRD